jgi:hypothetical protein
VNHDQPGCQNIVPMQWCILQQERSRGAPENIALNDATLGADRYVTVVVRLTTTDLVIAKAVSPSGLGALSP